MQGVLEKGGTHIHQTAGNHGGLYAEPRPPHLTPFNGANARQGGLVEDWPQTIREWSGNSFETVRRELRFRRSPKIFDQRHPIGFGFVRIPGFLHHLSQFE